MVTLFILLSFSRWSYFESSWEDGLSAAT